MCRLYKIISLGNVPVIRLHGSNTSIFSARSIAAEEKSGNFWENGCFGLYGSCLTYFLALSLLTNPRSKSSGEPSSYFDNNQERSFICKYMLYHNEPKLQA